jgi:hypothetical protein
MRGPLGYSSRRLAGALVIATSPLIFAANAVAQGAANDARSDIQQFRADAAASADRGSLVSRYAFGDETAGEPGKLGLTFNFLAPFFYNSNAEAAHVNGTQTLEANPEARLSASKQLAGLPVKFLGLVDANSDRFARSNGADSDTIYARVRAQYVTGQDDQEFEPFIQYRPEADFAPTFSRTTVTKQDFTVGFDKAFNFDVNFAPATSAPDTTRATVWSLGFTGTLTRRVTDVGPSSYRLTGSPSITYNLTNLPNANTADAQWTIALGVDVSRRWYDQQNGFSRRDWLLSPTLTVEFLPPLSWFRGENKLERENTAKAFGRPKVVFQIAYSQLDSTKPNVGFRQWQIGPTVKTGWTF